MLLHAEDGAPDATAGRLLADTTACESRCALDEVLGITRDSSVIIRTEIEQFSPSTTRNHPVPELRRHVKSKALLQDAFVRLHNFLFARGLLPLPDWGKGRGLTAANAPAWLVNATLVGRGIGYKGYHDGPSVLSRLGINAFVLATGWRAKAGSVCLGWDTTEFVDLVPGCERSKSWSLRYTSNPPSADHKRRIMQADITSLADESAVAKLNVRFNVIVCNEVFEHVRRPAEGARALYHLLRPRGLVLFTVPFNVGFHMVPTDFFRFSIDGGRALLADAGLTIAETYKIGDTAMTSGFLLGFGAGDFEVNHVAEHLLTRLRYPRTIGGDANRRWSRPGEMLSVGTCVVARRDT